MRLAASLAALWSLTVSLQTAAASSHGHVFLLDSTASLSASHHETIDPPSARLIFAERLGLSQFYEIENGDEEAIRWINAFGGSKQRLLGSDSTATPTRVFILVDGVEKPLDLVPTSPHISFFDINPAPHPSQSQQLVSELLSNDGRIISPAVINTPVENALQSIADLRGADTFSRGHERTIVHVRSLAEVRATYGDKSQEYKKHLESLRIAFHNLALLADEEPLVATVVLMPLQHHCSKQSANHYRVKRAEAVPAKMPRQESEEPLEVTPSDTSSPSQSTASFSPVQATGTLPLGPIPTCFSSKSACESATNNCTAHGVCSLKYKLTDGEKPLICFGCVCSIPEIVKTDGGQLTTWYGGGACQKKDIVAPFWLLAGTTVFFVSAISFGVSLLYTMGNAELPSVIGAGVSGPRPK